MEGISVTEPDANAQTSPHWVMLSAFLKRDESKEIEVIKLVMENLFSRFV